MTAARHREGAERGPEASRPALDDFLGEPTRRLEDWTWLWERDVPFPIRSHRGVVGRLLVGFKRLLRPLVRLPQNDLWERQRVFNLVVLEQLQAARDLERRVRQLETFLKEGLDEVMRYGDALYSRVDQKLDRYRREASEQSALLREALASASDGDRASTVHAALDGYDYRRLEDRYRGSEQEIAERIARYLPRLEGAQDVLDLGCGRGEALAVLAAAGRSPRGVDSSPEMVRVCRERGLEAVQGDLFEVLRSTPERSTDAVLSFHVIEHLEAGQLGELASLCHRVLRPGGVLLLETPSPLSLVAGARNFWRDPTHRRPVHPASLVLLLEHAGFEPVEVVEASPFPEAERLPEIALDDLESHPELAELADRVNRLRDRLDQLLFGFQDFAVVARRPPETAS